MKDNLDIGSIYKDEIGNNIVCIKELMLPRSPVFIKTPFMEPYWKAKEWASIFLSLLFRKDYKQKLINEVKDRFNVKYAFLTGNARVAGYLGMKALGLKSGDEVIIPSFFCRTLTQAVIQAGCVPHYVDIGEDFNMSLDSIKSAINNKTKAIIMVNMFGKLADYKKIRELADENNIYIIDDSAIAMGAKLDNRFAGTLGDFGLLSFNMGKNINATGGGVLLTNSEKIYNYVKQQNLKERKLSGEIKTLFYILTRLKLIKFVSPLYHLGVWAGLITPSAADISKVYRHNDRIPEEYAHKRTIPTEYLEIDRSVLYDEVYPKKINLTQARLAYIQIKRIDKINELCQRNARLYSEHLKGTKIICPSGSLPEHTYSYYTILTENRFELAEYLRKKGIGTQWTFYPLHLQERFCNYPKENMGNTERIWRKTLSLPIGPNLKPKQIRYICKTVKEWKK